MSWQFGDVALSADGVLVFVLGKVLTYGTFQSWAEVDGEYSVSIHPEMIGVIYLEPSGGCPALAGDALVAHSLRPVNE